MLEISTTNEQKIKITANPVTAAGSPASLDGPLRVTLLSGDAGAEVDPADPLSVIFTSGAPGDSTFLVEGDADLGAGQQLLQETVTYHVAGALAANFGFVVGQPEPK
jgi:hypothetical protein